MDTKEIDLDEFKNTLFDIQKLSYMIQDNKLPFTYNKEFYRARMPSQGEKAEAEDYRSEKQIEFIQRPNCKTRSEIKKILKDNNVVDLDKLDAQCNTIKKQFKNIYLKLAPKYNEDAEGVQADVERIKELQNQLQEVTQEINKHLAPSLEDRLEGVYLEYLVYLCTEKLKGENFERVWKNFEEYKIDNSPLATRAVVCMTNLLFNVRQF
jgi:hypothetical protein